MFIASSIRQLKKNKNERMKFKITLLISLVLSVELSLAQSNLQTDTMYIRCTQTLDFAFDQANRLLKSLSGTQLPNCVNASGGLVQVGAADWTSGFFPGELWYLANYKNDASMQTNAKKYTQLLQSQQYTTNTHDLGFMMYCSYGNGLKMANVTVYKDVLVQSANSLQGRFSDVVGCMRSWDFGSYTYPVIIDNMMNLELMFWATRTTGDSLYYKGAVSHALKTMKNHYRPNYSSFHLVDYDPSSGAVLKQQTVQGYSNSSSWARGQAWGLYGYAMCYNETGNIAFLNQARHIADYILSSLPADYVPYWDYNDPAIPNAPRDASAAAVAASGLLEMYRLGHDVAYLRAAEKILWNLSSPVYMNAANENQNMLLKHSTGNKPKNSQVDVPIIYADYYFVEALCRYVKLKNTVSVVPEVSDKGLFIRVFPTQFQDKISIQSKTVFDNVELVDISGKLVIKQLFSATNNGQLNVRSKVNNGFYFVKVSSGDDLIESKIVFK